MISRVLGHCWSARSLQQGALHRAVAEEDKPSALMFTRNLLHTPCAAGNFSTEALFLTASSLQNAMLQACNGGLLLTAGVWCSCAGGNLRHAKAQPALYLLCIRCHCPRREL